MPCKNNYVCGTEPAVADTFRLVTVFSPEVIRAVVLRESTRRFAEELIVPRAAEIDAKDQYLEHVIAIEEISRASASIGLSYGAHSNLRVIRRDRGEPQRSSRKLASTIPPTRAGDAAIWT